MIFDFTNLNIDSPFNIGLSMNGQNHKIVKDYFIKHFQTFCNDLHLNPTYFQEISFEFMFTDVEFNKHVPDENEESFINKTLYPKLFNDIKKMVFYPSKDREQLAWDFHTKFCFTLDKSLAPMQTNTGISYGTLNLGNKPVLYYIWIDTQTIINLIKNS